MRHGGPKAIEALARPLPSRRTKRRHPHTRQSSKSRREIAAGERAGASLLVVGEPDLSQPACRPRSPAADSVDHRRRFHPLAPLPSPSSALASPLPVDSVSPGNSASDLGEAGFVVVSGSRARASTGRPMTARLSTGTAAVLGGGVDDIYPPEHAALHKRDWRSKVASSLKAQWVTGRRLRTSPAATGLSPACRLGVVVVEAEMRSGSLITARLAGEQGTRCLRRAWLTSRSARERHERSDPPRALSSVKVSTTSSATSPPTGVCVSRRAISSLALLPATPPFWTGKPTSCVNAPTPSPPFTATPIDEIVRSLAVSRPAGIRGPGGVVAGRPRRSAARRVGGAAMSGRSEPSDHRPRRPGGEL